MLEWGSSRTGLGLRTAVYSKSPMPSCAGMKFVCSSNTPAKAAAQGVRTRVVVALIDRESGACCTVHAQRKIGYINKISSDSNQIDQIDTTPNPQATRLRPDGSHPACARSR